MSFISKFWPNLNQISKPSGMYESHTSGDCVLQRTSLIMDEQLDNQLDPIESLVTTVQKKQNELSELFMKGMADVRGQSRLLREGIQKPLTQSLFQPLSQYHDQPLTHETSVLEQASSSSSSSAPKPESVLRKTLKKILKSLEQTWKSNIQEARIDKIYRTQWTWTCEDVVLYSVVISWESLPECCDKIQDVLDKESIMSICVGVKCGVLDFVIGHYDLWWKNEGFDELRLSDILFKTRMMCLYMLGKLESESVQ